VSLTLPQPPNQAPILTVPDADVAIRVSLSQYLARLATTISQSFITSFATWTPGLIGNNGFVSATVTVRGISPPMPVYAGFTQAIPAGCILHAVCTSKDTVTVSIFNFTGAGQTINAGTLQITGSPTT
jgi:hypothetical protein